VRRNHGPCPAASKRSPLPRCAKAAISGLFGLLRRLPLQRQHRSQRRPRFPTRAPRANGAVEQSYEGPKRYPADRAGTRTPTRKMPAVCLRFTCDLPAICLRFATEKPGFVRKKPRGQLLSLLLRRLAKPNARFVSILVNELDPHGHECLYGEFPSL
jgi:hypothetical protein